MKSPISDLWVIDPSMAVPEEEGVAHILQGWEGPSRVFRPILSPDEMPPWELDYSFAGLVVMGSRASVHEPLPWLRKLSAWMCPLLDGRVVRPVLGICFGHQLIGHLAGGEVGLAFGDGEKRVAIEESVFGASRLLEGSGRLQVVVSHRESLLTLPPQYRMTAQRESVFYDGIEHQDLPVFGIQFHPEAGREFAQHCGLNAEMIDERVRADGARVLEGFKRLIRQRPSTSVP